MAKVSNGTTEIEFKYAIERIDPLLEKTSKRTGGGNIRSITSGERLNFSVQVRSTPAKYRLLLNMLKDGSSNYFYEPNDTSEWSDMYSSTLFPLNANFTNVKREWDRRDIYYIKFDVESVSYV